METADFETRYFGRRGAEIAPPAPTGDEDADILAYETFVLAHPAATTCTAEGTAVYAPESASGLERRCDRGHRNVSRSEIGAGWRQVS